LKSPGYVLLHFLRGSLLWQVPLTTNQQPKEELILAKKETIHTGDIFLLQKELDLLFRLLSMFFGLLDPFFCSLDLSFCPAGTCISVSLEVNDHINKLG